MDTFHTRYLNLTRFNYSISGAQPNIFLLINWISYFALHGDIPLYTTIAVQVHDCCIVITMPLAVVIFNTKVSPTSSSARKRQKIDLKISSLILNESLITFYGSVDVLGPPYFL